MSEAFTIFAGSSGPWHVGCLRDGQVVTEPVNTRGDARADELAPDLAAALGELGWSSDQPVLLALPSSWCLAAEVSIEGLARGSRRRSMTFRLEEHLPVSAEDVVADFCEFRKEQALGVAVEGSRLMPIVDALENCDVRVASIAPTALLAGQYHSHNADAVSLADNIGEVEGAITCDWIELDRNRPLRWQWFADDRASLIEAVRALEPGRSVVSIGSQDDRLNTDETSDEVECMVPDEGGVLAAAVRQARAVLSHAEAPWVELRQGALALPDHQQACRRPTVALVAAAAVLLAVLSGVLYWRGLQYDDLAGSYRREQVEVFRRAIPDQRPPRDVLGRMRSEYRKLAGIGGHALDASGAPRPTSALVHLRNVLASLPGDVRFRITRIDIAPESMRVAGQARSYALAERLAVSLRRTGRYRVEMNETQTVSPGTVQFSFTATPAELQGGAG